MSLFEGLHVATRGLSAAQLAVNVTGQNITNASTEGYSRKRVEQNADWRRDGSFGQIGYGVEVYTINRVRDQFIDKLLNEEYTRYGYYAVKDLAFGRIEDIFTEPSDHALNSLLNKFWNGWADVANDPSDIGKREALRSNAQTLITQFHYISTQLTSYKNIINDEIESRVNKINELTAGIYKCNTIIAPAEASLGHKANDTRDQRDLMLQELASIIDVDYFEDDRGVLNVSSNGHVLVSFAKNHELIMNRTQYTELDGEQYAKVEMALADTGRTFSPKGGELRALMDIRDVEIPKYQEYINSVAKNLVVEVNKIHQNGYALSDAGYGLTFIDFFATDASKLQAARENPYDSQYDALRKKDPNFVDNDPFFYINARSIGLSEAILQSTNNIAAAGGGKIETVSSLNNSPALDPRLLGYTLAVPVGGPSEFLDLATINPLYATNWDSSSLVIATTTGVPLVEGTDYNILAGGVIEFLDTALTNSNQVNISFNYNAVFPAGMDVIPQLFAPGTPGNPPTTHSIDLGSVNDSYRLINKGSVEIRNAANELLQEGKDYDVDYNRGIITFKYSAINNAFDDVAGTQISITFDYRKGGYAGPGDGDNALLLSQLRNKNAMHSDAFGNKTQTINQFYSGMLGRLGTERNEAASGLNTRVDALKQLKDRQDEVMGVNLDEEMASLIQYEYTYQASARYFTTLNDMLETLLTM